MTFVLAGSTALGHLGARKIRIEENFRSAGYVEAVDHVISHMIKNID